MDLVIRLKRPRNVDPYDALILASKRRKKEKESDGNSAENDEGSTILKFAGTLSHQGEDITPHICKAKEHVELKSMNRQKSKDVINKVRSEAKRASKENRLKVINMSRAIPNVLLDHNYVGFGDSKGVDVAQYTIVDVVHDGEEELDSESSRVEADDRYVYSLYFANSAGGEINDGFLDSLVSIEPLDTSIVHICDYRDQNDDINADDDDDSNDENNWRNDYPDSDPDNEGQDSEESVDFQMDRLKLDSENELSSDDGEGDLPYGVDHEQVLNLGRTYAQYKAKIMMELKDGELEDDNEYASEVVSSQSEEDNE